MLSTTKYEHSGYNLLQIACLAPWLLLFRSVEREARSCQVDPPLAAMMKLCYLQTNTVTILKLLYACNPAEGAFWQISGVLPIQFHNENSQSRAK